MLTEMCSELNNYFDRDQNKVHGDIAISGGILQNASGYGLKVGQYYRIIGSVFNDGVHRWTGTPDEGLTDETFSGSVWLMAIPPEFLKLAKEIEDWVKEYGKISMSPYASENLSASSYSYSLNTGAGSGNGASWQNIFAKKMSKWRKTRP